MGRKGVSKRKPRKEKSKAATDAPRMGDNPSVQALVKDKDAPFNRGGANPHTGLDKKGKKDKR